MLKVKNIPFVGGDTATFEFDFGTKVPGSNVECPMILYYGESSSLMTPSTSRTGVHNVIGIWNTDDTVAYSKLAKVDNECESFNISNANYISQYMLELDLTSLCNALFGGSNSAMVAALRGLNVDVWAKGSGVSNGVLTNNCEVDIWEANGNVINWIPISPYGGHYLNQTSNIVCITSSTELTSLMNSGNHVTKDGSLYINSSNKVYFLVTSHLPSNGTIASEVDIDYLNIRFKFARVPDVISPIPITLPDTWSMLIKGFSPAYSSSDSLGNTRCLFQIGDNINANEVSFGVPATKQMQLAIAKNGNWAPSDAWYSSVQSFDKFQIFNILIEQTVTGMRYRILKNKSTVEKASTSIMGLKGDWHLYVGKANSLGYASDAFFNSFIFMPNRVFDDDTEAENVLRGITSGFENDDLWDYDSILHGSNATIDKENKQINVTSTIQYDGVTVNIPVLPNNQYTLTGTIGTNGYINVYQRANTTVIDPHYSITLPYTFTTKDKVNQLTFNCGILQSGSAQFNNLSLKLKM